MDKISVNLFSIDNLFIVGILFFNICYSPASIRRSGGKMLKALEKIEKILTIAIILLACGAVNASQIFTGKTKDITTVEKDRGGQPKCAC